MWYNISCLLHLWTLLLLLVFTVILYLTLFVHLRKHSELGNLLSLGMDAEEQAILGEDQGDGVQW